MGLDNTAVLGRISSALVSGASGFIGSALCDRLVKNGVNVVAAVRQTAESNSPFPLAEGESEARGQLGWGLERRESCASTPSLAIPLQGGGDDDLSGIKPVVVGEIDGDTDWSQALAGVEVIFHLAARVHVMRETAADPLAEFRNTNVAGTEQLARSAAAAGVRRLVYVSSIKVNGEETGQGRQFSEADAPAPQDPYGISKWEAEQVLQRVADETGLEVVIVRPPLVYGPGVKGNFAQMLAVVAKGFPLPFASVRNQRSLVYVGNLVDALIVCAIHPAAAGQTYLVSDGEDVSTPELLRQLAGALRVPARLLPCPPALLRLAGRLTGKHEQVERLLGSLQVDSGKIRRELNWLPPYTLQQGLQNSADWRRSRNI